MFAAIATELYRTTTPNSYRYDFHPSAHDAHDTIGAMHSYYRQKFLRFSPITPSRTPEPISAYHVHALRARAHTDTYPYPPTCAHTFADHLGANSEAETMPTVTGGKVPHDQPRFAFGRKVEDEKTKKQTTSSRPELNRPESITEMVANYSGLDSATPYRDQRDDELYTPENLRRRAALKHHPKVQRQINRIWALLQKNEDGRLGKEQYCELFIRLCKVLNADFDLEDAIEVVEEDFIQDAQGEDALTYDLFYQSLFELADIWVPTIDGGLLIETFPS